MHTRRTFLLASSATCALAALPPSLRAESLGGNAFSPGYLDAYTQGLLTQARFESVLGSLFMVLTDDGSAAYFRLTAVTSDGSQNAAATGLRSFAGAHAAATVSPIQTFGAQFTAQSPATLAQGTYILDHGTLGRFSALLVPGAAPDGTFRCTATFTTLTAAAVTNNPILSPVSRGPGIVAAGPLGPPGSGASSGSVPAPASPGTVAVRPIGTARRLATE